MSALFSGLNIASSAWADPLYRQHIHPTPGAGWAAWLAGWTWVVSVIGFIAIAYFPDGRLPSRRWAVAPAAVVAAGLSIVIGNAFAPRIDDYQIPSPLPGPHITSIGDATSVLGALMLAGIIGCLASVLVKFRRSGPVARRQIGWYAYGYAITAAVLVAAVTTNLPSALLAIGPVCVATGAAIAILKLRLYDIDRIVNRTLAWGLLTALVIALYVISVGFFERSFAGGGSIGGLLATAIVAVAFQPLRVSVQRAVNQLIYGNRDQPEVVFRELAATLDPETGTADPLATLAGTLARSLRLPASSSMWTAVPIFRRPTRPIPHRSPDWSRSRRHRPAGRGYGCGSGRAAPAACPPATGSSWPAWPHRWLRPPRRCGCGMLWSSHGYGRSARSPRSSAGCGVICTMVLDRCWPACA